MTEEQIKHMVQQFLAWKLPVSFNPDGYVRFGAPPGLSQKDPLWPTGTNVLDASQAELMVRHMLKGLSQDAAREATPVDPHKALAMDVRHAIDALNDAISKAAVAGLSVTVDMIEEKIGRVQPRPVLTVNISRPL